MITIELFGVPRSCARLDRLQADASCVVEAEDLRTIAPQLEALRNLNAPEDYRRALEEAGLSRDAE